MGKQITKGIFDYCLYFKITIIIRGEKIRTLASRVNAHDINECHIKTITARLYWYAFNVFHQQDCNSFFFDKVGSLAQSVC